MKVSYDGFEQLDQRYENKDFMILHDEIEQGNETLFFRIFIFSVCEFLSIDDRISDNDRHSNDYMDSVLCEEHLYQSAFDLSGILSDYDNIYQHQLFSQLINFIHDAKLNKTTTRSLLKLLHSTCLCTADEIPKTIDALWQQLGVAFTFKTFYYCSTCFMELIRYQDICPECNLKVKANSELCIFSISDELERVVQSNINVIQWYSLPEHQIIADIVNGMSYTIVLPTKSEVILFYF